MRLCVLAAVLVASALTACGDDDDSAGGSQPAEQSASAPDPIGCLEEVALSNPERRAPGLWRATEPGAGTLILIERMPSPADAQQAARQATEVAAEAVGRYYVHGPLLDVDDGSTAAVATCLPSVAESVSLSCPPGGLDRPISRPRLADGRS